MKRFQRILVATDLSPASKPAVDKALALAEENGSELMIAHAYQPPSVIEAESVAAGVYEEWNRNIRADVERKLWPLIVDAKNRGIHAGVLVLSGTPYEAIVQAAKENNADLVIMGTHGRKGVSRFFLGSVASRVITTAPCPVMTVRAV